MKAVMACGCFDLLHYGHLLHLRHARALGDRLIVALSPDTHVSRKGVDRPRFSWAQRAEMLAELRCVDAVVPYINSVAEVINVLRPDIYVKGKEYEGRLPEQALVESYGGRVVFTQTPKWSSTKLLEEGF